MTKVLCMSGYPADVLDPAEILEGDVDFLPKPFSISALTTAVRRALDREA
jgi:FixJ family two-component response regulator